MTSTELNNYNQDQKVNDDKASLLDTFDGFPITSHFYHVGVGLMNAGRSEAIHAFKRGAESGCVPCIAKYCTFPRSLQWEWVQMTLPLIMPWLLEAAIRGDDFKKGDLFDIYLRPQSVSVSRALADYWAAYCVTSLSTRHIVKRKERKDIKNMVQNVCIICNLTDFDEGVTLEKCEKCKCYCYCGKKCQLIQWTEHHMGECRQLTILNKYHKPYANEIREAIKSGEDPKSVVPLQVLRNKLGLIRPKQDYEEVMNLFSDDDDYNNDDKNHPNRYKYLIARKDGTVQVGSTPEVI